MANGLAEMDVGLLGTWLEREAAASQQGVEPFQTLCPTIVGDEAPPFGLPKRLWPGVLWTVDLGCLFLGHLDA